jgi:hypothetical protein
MATLVELQAELVKLQAAYDKALVSQSYGIGDRSLTRPNLKVIIDRMNEVRIAIARISGSSTTYPRFSTR